VIESPHIVGIPDHMEFQRRILLQQLRDLPQRRFRFGFDLGLVGVLRVLLVGVAADLRDGVGIIP
jgi:hypothetical protein